MRRIHSVIALIYLLLLNTSLIANYSAKDEISHSFVCTDYTQGKVFIISAKGLSEWEYPAENCNNIWILPNGNTLIACSDHNGDPRVVEADKSGIIIWQLSKNELPGIELKFMTGMQYLPNGNLLLTNWLGHNQFGKASHAFEITREKKVVWVYNDFSILKTMSSIQLLDYKMDTVNNNILH